MKLKQSHRGFTLIELLVVVSIIALLISILLPSLGRAKELANRVHCSANLKGITSSFIVYGMENNDEFPLSKGPDSESLRTYKVPVGNVVILGSTSLDSVFNFVNADITHQGDAFSPFYMLVGMKVNPKIFLCKSDRVASNPASLQNGDSLFYDRFQDRSQISYSVVYPWSGSSRAPWWRNTADSNMVVASDMAPFKDASGYKDPAIGTGKLANSENHEGAGQNISYADGHVAWERTPKAGPVNDNIFTLKATSSDSTGVAITEAGKLPNGVGPGTDDVIMVPTRSSVDYDLK